MYRLEAVIADRPVLRELTGPAWQSHIVPLDEGLSLLPMTDALSDALAVAGAPGLDGFWKAPAGLGGRLAACSSHGPAAYVEAEFFGGTGTQSAQVWDRGAVVLGPLHTTEDEPTLPAGSPISQALRRLGVARGDHLDEFDAADLGRHRRTEAWLPTPR